MSVFLAKRLATLIATLIAISIVVFAVMNILPGDPAMVILGLESTEDARAALREQLGLNAPAHIRYFQWVGGVLTGDFGISYTYDLPVATLILERLPVTVPLAILSMILTVILALILGTFAASNHNRPGDWGVMAFSQLGIAIPNFWLAILLIIVFAVNLRLVPTGGFPGWENGIWPALRALILPSIALALVQAAILARITRSSLLEVMRQDFVRTARAKGLSKLATLRRHVLQNGMIPVVTVGGLQFANLMTGTIVVENLMYLPGLGRLVFQSISNRDLPTVQALVLLFAVLVVLVNFLVDLIYSRLDPRLTGQDA